MSLKFDYFNTYFPKQPSLDGICSLEAELKELNKSLARLYHIQLELEYYTVLDKIHPILEYLYFFILEFLVFAAIAILCKNLVGLEYSTSVLVALCVSFLWFLFMWTEYAEKLHLTTSIVLVEKYYYALTKNGEYENALYYVKDMDCFRLHARKLALYRKTNIVRYKASVLRDYIDILSYRKQELKSMIKILKFSSKNQHIN